MGGRRLEYSRKYGPHGELFFSLLIKKEPFALTKAVEIEPFVPEEMLRACAVIGLHLMAAGSASGSSSSCDAFSPELGGIPGLSGPRHSLWKDEDEWGKVHAELTIMKDEIKAMNMGSNSTVSSAANTGFGLDSGTCAKPPTLGSNWRTSLNQGKLKSKDG